MDEAGGRGGVVTVSPAALSFLLVFRCHSTSLCLQPSGAPTAAVPRGEGGVCPHPSVGRPQPPSLGEYLLWRVAFFQEQPPPQHGVSGPLLLPLLLKRVSADGHGLPIPVGAGWHQHGAGNGCLPARAARRPRCPDTVHCHAATSCSASHSLKALEPNY